ncbi:MAG: helix-turn-helix transcriptional regulator [Cellulosilyticum sp.]|nr:helix-turn-helix transcriptional regulator [Cellulosilyticum sp.]
MDKDWENILAVQRMQDYIVNHKQEEITLYQLARESGYSPWYATKIFKQYLGKSPFAYIRALKLSEAALKIRDEEVKILDIALDFQFDFHEGFSRAFKKSFGVSPKKYQKDSMPIPLYKPSPVKEEYITMKKIDEGILARPRILKYNYTTQIMQFPKRKLIFKRGKAATNYFEYELENEGLCQNVWGTLCSIKEALNEPMGIWFNSNYRKEGTSIYVQGVEVPLDYQGKLPEGFECIELPEQLVLIFQSKPYEEEDFMEEILDLQNYIRAFNPNELGYEWDEEGYCFQLEPQGERGYIEGRSIKCVK